MKTEPTSLIAHPPEIPDLNPNIQSASDMISIPPLDPLFLSASDPNSIDNFADFDFSFDDSDDFFNFTLDADQTPEEIENHADLDSPEETKNGDRGSDSVHSHVSSQGSKTTFASSACDASSSSSPERSSVSKRKKEKGDTGGGGEYRSFKYQKSSASVEEDNDDEEKKKVRQIRNRKSAQLSRLRKKQYVEELQGRVKSMTSTISELSGKIAFVMAENAALRHQMSAAASGAPPPPMNPYMAALPLPYQWMPYPYYPVRGYGSNTPLVPIPKVNPKPVSSCRPKNKGKSKMKKVASISFIGILFFIFLFGTLVPFMNVNYGGVSGSFGGLSKYEGRRYYDERRGKVLMVGDGSDVARDSWRRHGEREEYNFHPRVDGRPSPPSNASEPLFASLYVPRNDGLVKIDGNLIIHSVLATVKAKKNMSETMKREEPELRTPGVLSSALAVPDVRGNGAMLPQSSKALSSGSPEVKILHQWFHEGGSGALMDYSMCTEVFQFNIAPGAIVPSSVSNTTREHLQNVTSHDKRMKNRRILERLPVSLVASELNITKTQPSKDAQNSSFHGEANTKPKSSSSMVVSVLLDPKEVVDSETDRVMPSKAKSLSRIFVVVLLDSVKYVTYLCVLPQSGLHLVAT